MSSDTKPTRYQGSDAAPVARRLGPADEGGERANQALVALVRLLARQAAREALSDPNKEQPNDKR